MSNTDLPERDPIDAIFVKAWDEAVEEMMKKHLAAGLDRVDALKATLADAKDLTEKVNDGYFTEDADHAYDQFIQDGEKNEQTGN